MKRKICCVALVLAVSLGSNLARADGDFYVIGGGAPGTKITSLPKTINTPGFYYLTGNLSYSGTSDGISIDSDGVTIDLMGFELRGPASGSYTGIMIGSGLTDLKNVEVRMTCPPLDGDNLLKTWASQELVYGEILDIIQLV